MTLASTRRDELARAEAAAWLARLHADDRTAADERLFKAWLAEQPQNASAFEDLTMVWDAAGGVHAPVPQSSSRPSRRGMLLAAVGAAVAGGGGFLAWDVAFAGVYETAVGEQKHVSLRDGSQLLLDTDTKIRVRLGSRQRELHLLRGRVNVRVAPDPQRPFLVEAASRRLVTARSMLDVRRDAGLVTVVLVRGQALLEASDSTTATPNDGVLKAGERLVSPDTRPARIDTPDMTRALAWQTGQAVFDDETLGQAAAEMNRYSTVPIETPDPAVARLRISGVYRVGDNEAFARSVAALLPVRVREGDGRISLTSADVNSSGG